MNFDETTNFTVFPDNKSTEINLSLNSLPVIKLHNCKYLGLYIGDKLSWKYQVDNGQVCRDILQAIGYTKLLQTVSFLKLFVFLLHSDIIMELCFMPELEKLI